MNPHRVRPELKPVLRKLWVACKRAGLYFDLRQLMQHWLHETLWHGTREHREPTRIHACVMHLFRTLLMCQVSQCRRQGEPRKLSSFKVFDKWTCAPIYYWRRAHFL
jgi:hypothetical protein